MWIQMRGSVLGIGTPPPYFRQSMLLNGDMVGTFLIKMIGSAPAPGWNKIIHPVIDHQFLHSILRIKSLNIIANETTTHQKPKCNNVNSYRCSTWYGLQQVANNYRMSSPDVKLFGKHWWQNVLPFKIKNWWPDLNLKHKSLWVYWCTCTILF